MVKVLTYGAIRIWCCLALFVFCKCVYAQDNYRLHILPVDRDSVFISKLGLRTNFPGKLQCNEYVMRLPALLQAKGFITASLDSLAVNDSAAVVQLFLGNEYRLANIKISDTDLPFLQQAGYRANNSSTLNFQQYHALQEVLLDQFENTGYPFARIQLDSVNINSEQIEAVLAIDKGLYYRVDSIHVQGPARISRNFIHRYLNIERGSMYSQQKLAKISQRLLELPYLQQAQPWDVTMLSTSSIVNLYLQPKKSNEINVLAGFLPDNQQLGGGKLLFTIDANLQLKNAFGSGESIGLVWQQIQPRSPRLNLVYQQPYLFNSPFGIDFSFDLFKKDSTFLNLNAELGLRYALSINKSAKISIQNQRTNVLQIDTFRIKNTKQLPDIADVSSINLGLEYAFNNTDYRFNPRKGNDFNLYIGAGNKKVRKNTTITQIKDPGFNYNSLYDSLKLNTYQVRVKLQAARYFAMGRQSVFKTAVNAGVYESPNFFRNELFQIGGYRLLRGFDEESIFANRYGVGTLEYRYLLGLNSYFFGFTDIAWSRFSNNTTKFSNSYIGAGVGLAFETKGGIFNISYAAGKRNDLRFNIKESKIHFGYVSVF
jgi:outer membrane protein assembly factor BamA